MLAHVIYGSGTEKPIVGFITRLNAPPGRRMGHDGAIVTGRRGTAQDKIRTLKKAGVTVVESPAKIGSAMLEAAIEKTSSELAECEASFGSPSSVILLSVVR